MTVHLTPEEERLIRSKIETGRYNSATEVVGDALRLLEEHDRLQQVRMQEVRRKIQDGWDSLRHGEGTDGEQFMSELSAGLDEIEKNKTRQ